MADWFYTDSQRKQQGPVDEEEILRLNSEELLNADSLIWKEGLPEWRTLGTLASEFFGKDEEGLPVEYGVCAFSKKLYPINEMMPYGEALIGVDQKDGFVQSLMETGISNVKDATENSMDYIGFWWRVLSSTIDYFVKVIPSQICIYGPVMLAGGFSATELASDEFVGGMALVGYGIGMLLVLAISIFYETWMVGKYGGTLGKMAIGAKVVNPDGSKVSYARAFVRWLCKKPLNNLIMQVPIVVLLVLMIGVGSSEALVNGERPALGFSAFAGAMAVALVLSAVFSGVYWMAAFDSEKRALHDRISATRVVKK